MAIGVRWIAALTFAIAVAQGEAAPAKPTIEAALQEAQALLGKDLPKARTAFERIVATWEGHWYQPLAEVGLATVERLEQNAFQGLVRLQRVREQLVRQAPAGGKHPLHDIVQRRILIESMYCHVALGLFDLARADSEALDRLLPDAQPVERYGACLAELDRRIGAMEWGLARSRARSALQEPELLRAWTMAGEELGIREAMAARRLARTPASAAEVGRTLEARLAAVTEAPLRFRLTMEAAAAWLAAGSAAGLARVHSLCADLEDGRPPAECAEVLAMRARQALARGAALELADLREGLVAAVAASHAKVRETPVRAGGVGFFHFETARNPLSVLLALDRRVQPDAPEVAFAHLESGFALGSLSRRLAGSVATVAAVRANLLPEQGGLLAYLLAPAGGHAVAMDRDGIVHEEFAVDEPFLAEIRELTRGVEHEPTDRSPTALAAWRERAARVAMRLLPPSIATRLGRWREIVLVGDEQGVGRIWQALPWRDGWTCTSFAATHVGSAALGLALVTRARTRPEAAGERLDVAVVGDPVHAAGTERFGVGPLELSDAQRLLLLSGMSARRQEWWRADAGLAALHDPRVASARALCVVVHGIQDPSRERFAGLLLAPSDGTEGTVFAEQIERLTVPPLVVLAACSPGLAPQRVGEDGGSHPGGAFLFAGADTVVLASGQIPLDASLELLGVAFGALGRGASLPAALQQGRLRIAAQPARQHPYYFAGLRVIGLAGPPRR